MNKSAFQYFLTISITVFISALASVVNAETPWPLNNQVAISLSYDDALDSQLDNAIPALNQRNLKASFYVVPLSTAFEKRISEWKQVAIDGHELGNHTLVHSCQKSQANRDWVAEYNDLDTRTVLEMAQEVTLANTLLKAMDGHVLRTFTPPCNDRQAKDGNYLEAVKEKFIAIKGSEDPSFARLIAPSEISAKQIIDFVEKQPKNIKLVNVLFHGVGGDHLMVSTAEHNKFLDYLQANKNLYWVDTYRNIMLARLKANTSPP